MLARPSLTLLIPSLNEADHIGGMLDALAEQPLVRALGDQFSVLVIDDGGSDRIADVVRARAERLARLELLRLPRTQGKGRALAAGLARGTSDFVAFADGDDTFDLSALAPFYAALCDGADIAIGDRRLPGSCFEIANAAIPYIHLRARVGECFNLLVRACTPLRVLDTQCGLKMFRREAARHCFERIAVGGFIFDVEVLLAATAAGFRVVSLPVRLRYRSPEPMREVVTMSAQTLAAFVRVLLNERSGRYRGPSRDR
jgi:glycosyltransferase involved in cell wall biosynthesis